MPSNEQLAPTRDSNDPLGLRASRLLPGILSSARPVRCRVDELTSVGSLQSFMVPVRNKAIVDLLISFSSFLNFTTRLPTRSPSVTSPNLAHRDLQGIMWVLSSGTRMLLDLSLYAMGRSRAVDSSGVCW